MPSSHLKKYPSTLLQAIENISSRCRVQVYVVGGTVRDWLRGLEARDLDLAVSGKAVDFARLLAGKIGGTFVLLDEAEDTARVAWNDYVVDVAGFRKNSSSITEDLLERDFTINSMAVCFADAVSSGATEKTILDPAGGQTDLSRKIIRALGPESFVDDPLRLLRAFRFAAETGFQIDSQTRVWITEHVSLLGRVSSERISYELRCIMATDRAYDTFLLLKKSGVLFEIFPELQQGSGIKQPSSHHLDVFEHNMEALRQTEKILARPSDFFSDNQEIARYLSVETRKIWLKWAAIFHDLGKPASLHVRDGRITFYNHDKVGVDIFLTVAARLKWSKDMRGSVSRLISLHMWPFHLSNVRRKGKNGVTPRACLKIHKAAGEHLPGLFILAMADSLAGQGEGKPPDMEQNLVDLFSDVVSVCRKNVEPVLSGPRLITGKDLIELGLSPGPFFKQILDQLEKEQVQGTIRTTDQAREWVRKFLSMH